MAAGLRPETALLERFLTREASAPWQIPRGVHLSFSGGVADCIAKDFPMGQFGDIGPLLGRAIRESRLCRGEFFLGKETIRATVIGAGCHTTQLSGSTVFCQNLPLPLKNLPVAAPETMDAAAIARSLTGFDQEQVVLALPGFSAPDYSAVKQLAKTVLEGVGQHPVLVCLEADMAKALGHCLRLLLPEDAPCLCLDGLHLEPGMYLDVGQPVGPAIPVVIKTLVLSGGIG
jgi:ethanolamine utilization protein EutA